MPLMGKTILVTRSVGQSSQFSDRLMANGANVIEMPTLEIGPPSSWESLDRAIANLDSFHWLILTSTNGVDYFWERLIAQGKGTFALAGIKIAVVGEKTAQSLRKYGMEPDFIPHNFIADALVAQLSEELIGKKVLFPRVETGGREVLVKELTSQGVQVVEVPAYQSGCPRSIPLPVELALRNREIDIITFASSKTVQYFCELTKGKFGENYLNQIWIASIGPQTSQACHALLGRVNIEAAEYTLDGLIAALIAWVDHE